MRGCPKRILIGAPKAHRERTNSPSDDNVSESISLRRAETAAENDYHIWYILSYPAPVAYHI